MQKLNLIEEMTELIENAVTTFNEFSIKDLGKTILPIDELKDIFHTLNKDNKELNQDISNKTNELVEELNCLIQEKNLDFTAQLECGQDVVFMFQEEKLGRLNLVNGQVRIFSTLMDYEYEKVKLRGNNNVSMPLHFLIKPNFQEVKTLSKQSISCNSLDLKDEIERLEKHIKSLNEKIDNDKEKLRAIRRRGLVKNRKQLAIKWVDVIALTLYNSSYSTMVEKNIKEIRCDKQVVGLLLETLKEISNNNPTTIKAIYYNQIIKSKKELKHFLINDLNIDIQNVF